MTNYLTTLGYRFELSELNVGVSKLLSIHTT